MAKSKTPAHPAWVELLAEILRNSPPLGEGACRRVSPAIFDAETPEAIKVALDVCSTCPVLDQCRAWARAQPRKSLHGVVGGELRDER